MVPIAVSSGTVLALITLAVLPIAAISFARSGEAWREIGKGSFSIEHDPAPRPAAGHAEPEVDRDLQEAEARQMLEAKAYRHQRRGDPGIDVEAEVARLLAAGEEAAGGGRGEELRAEVRALVIARNERRARSGEPPLDVETETDRQLADLIGLEER